jgi:hypothetical protein
VNNPNDYNSYNDYQNQYDVENERRIRLETEKLRQLLIEIDKKHSQECTLNVGAQWNFETNVNEASQLEAVSRVTQLHAGPTDIDPHARAEKAK